MEDIVNPSMTILYLQRRVNKIIILIYVDDITRNDEKGIIELKRYRIQKDLGALKYFL